MADKAKPASTDPWEEAAAQYKASGQQGGTAAPDDDWKIWQQNSAPEAEPTMLQKAMTGASDFGKGLGRSAVSLMSTGDEMARKIPGIGEWLTTPLTGTPADQAIAHVHQMATPENTTQAVGKGIGDVAQFLIPGGAEEKAVQYASLLPKAEKAMPLVKAIIAGTSAGAVNKAQGGSFGAGMAAGAAGSGIGSGLRAIAPKLAESSIGINKIDRAFGKTPGKAILGETKGILPETIAKTGQERLGQLTPKLESAAAGSLKPVSMGPARQVVSDAARKAVTQNAPTVFAQTEPMSDFLAKRFNTGAAIPQDVSAADALNLKRGFSKEFLGRWNPETHGDTIATGRGAYHALDKAFDEAVPESAGLNQRISSLIPVVQRAESTARNAPMAQMMMKRIGAPTGGLLGTVFGGEEGYKHGGLPGAIAGAGAGLLAPVMVSTPEGQMALARAFNSAKALRPVVGAALTATRKSSRGGQEE